MSTPPPALLAAATHLARRSWLKLLASAAALATAGGGWWAWRSQQTPQTVAELEAAMLVRMVDTLVPRDDTPGALDLGVHHTVAQTVQANSGLSLACSELFQTLDRAARVQHHQPFLALSAAEQDLLLQAVAQAGRGSPGWPALMQLRAETLQQYYAQPQAWAPLGLANAPQPLGFMDYAQAPRPRG